MTASGASAGWRVNRVGLWGPCGSGNMGNEMTMAALVQNLRRLHPEIVLRGFSTNPADTFERYGIPSSLMMAPRRRRTRGLRGAARRAADRALAPVRQAAFMNQARQQLKDLDLLVFGGTGILTDSWGGPSGFPYNVFMWTSLSRLSGTRVAVVSAGAGPLDSGLSRRLIGSALGQAAYRSFRDEYSSQLVESLGVTGRNHVSPDLAFSLTFPGARQALSDEHRREIAIVGLPYRKPGHWEKPSEAVYERYLDVMAEFTCWLMAAGYTVRLVPTHVRMDLTFISDLKSRVALKSANASPGRLLAEEAETFDQIAAQLSAASITVSSRFHGVVFSYLVGTPVLGVSYHPKMDALMKGFGQGEFCVDLPTADVADLKARFARIQAGRQDVSCNIRRTLDVYKTALSEQYERLLRL